MVLTNIKKVIEDTDRFAKIVDVITVLAGNIVLPRMTHATYVANPGLTVVTS